MCGRFSLKASDAQALAQRFKARPDARALKRQQPRYNIAPTQDVLAVITAEGERILTTLRWGLVPAWSKDASAGYATFNARAETLSERPAFKDSFRQRRCLIPADSFYEWIKLPDGKKQPVRILLKSEELFAFAGLWSSWKDPATGDELLTCTIITTEPNALLRPLHNRMPAILLPDEENAWLDVNGRESDRQKLLRPYPDDALRHYPVSPQLNNVKNDKAELQQCCLP